jgi:hypothetical protein
MSKEQNRPSRRGFFMGTGAVAAVAAVATVSNTLTTQDNPVQAKQPTPERGGGYNVSEHIKRYYRTARV